MKKNLMIAIVIEIVLVIAAIFMYVKWDGSQGQDFQYIRSEEVYRLLSFTYYSEDEWKDNLSDELSKRVSKSDLETILDKLGLSDYISCDNVSKQVTREQFYTIYDQILDILDVDNAVSNASVLVLGDPDDTDTAETSIGSQSLGFLSKYVSASKVYQVYLYNGTIIGIRGNSQEAVTLNNVYVTDTDNGQVSFIVGDQTYTYDADVGESISNVICDIGWENGEIKSISKKEASIEGRILSYTDTSIEIEGYGVITTEDNFRLYRVYDGVQEISRDNLIIGNMSAKFVVAGDKISACLLNEPESLETIRVLLKGNQTAETHTTFGITSDVDFTLTTSTGTTTLTAGSVLSVDSVSADDLANGITVAPADGSKLYLTGMAEFDSTIGYDGTFEIRSYDGSYAIINELSLEKYLYGVVPSEMPSSFEKEAQKVQAVCARSYAYNCICQSAYPEYGAHLDDSTAFQVYNKGATNDTAIAAVDETVGQVLKYNDQVLSTYYFSTSCGLTTDPLVWNWEEGTDTTYLSGVCLSTSPTTDFDYSSSDAFLAYLQSDASAYYENQCPYFRWSTTINIPDGDTYRTIISNLKAASSEDVMIYDNSQKETTADKLGTLESISVTKRSKSGCAYELCLDCTKGTVYIETENKVRTFLGNFVSDVTLQDGTTASSSKLLPSAFFVITTQSVSDDVLTGSITGGGYGHGLGMSQNGANAMAKQGAGYLDILNTFYQNITVENLTTTN